MSITDAQWNRIKCLFEQRKQVGRPPLNPRDVLNGILWILASGGRWRDLPPWYGSWNSIYHKFRQWCDCDSGLFQLLLYLINLDAPCPTLLEMNAAICKAHQHSAVARKCLGNQAIGTCRDGKTTKIHSLVDENMHLLKAALTGGQVHSGFPVLDLLAVFDLAEKKILAGKAHSCEQICFFMEEQGAQVCIPDKINFKVKHHFNKELYNQCSIVERFFQRIKNFAIFLRVMISWRLAA